MTDEHGTGHGIHSHIDDYLAKQKEVKVVADTLKDNLMRAYVDGTDLVRENGVVRYEKLVSDKGKKEAYDKTITEALAKVALTNLGFAPAQIDKVTPAGLEDLLYGFFNVTPHEISRVTEAMGENQSYEGLLKGLEQGLNNYLGRKSRAASEALQQVSGQEIVDYTKSKGQIKPTLLDGNIEWKAEVLKHYRDNKGVVTPAFLEGKPYAIRHEEHGTGHGGH